MPYFTTNYRAICNTCIIQVLQIVHFSYVNIEVECSFIQSYMKGISHDDNDFKDSRAYEDRVC